MSGFELFPGSLQDVLTDPTGPVGIFLEEACLRVESQAKVNASGRPGPRVRTGRLRSSIFSNVVVEGPGLIGYVISPVEYSGYVETGTSRSRPYPYLGPSLAAA